MNDVPEWHARIARKLLVSTPIHTGEVHAQDTSKSPAHATYELLGEILTIDVPTNPEVWANETKPNLPWAEDHFQERVSGIPHNPAPSHEWWPFAQRGNAQHMKGDVFSHTYPERFWPKYAGRYHLVTSPRGTVPSDEHRGIRFNYGDLSDLVDLLVKNPLSRQAYLPVWFPEDLTAAVKGERVPCTLGYHFLIRGGKLHCWYSMRSCDAVRYLRDDVYMAGRLMQWVANKVNAGMAPAPEGVMDIETGTLTLAIMSLHAFVGDAYTLNKLAR